MTGQLCPEPSQSRPTMLPAGMGRKLGAACADLGPATWGPALAGAGVPSPRRLASSPLTPSSRQVPSWPACSPFSVVFFYLTTGPSDFELLRRSVKAAFLLESKEETDLMFCPQGEKQGHFN